jgi:hypothetical protein
LVKPVVVVILAPPGPLPMSPRNISVPRLLESPLSAGACARMPSNSNDAPKPIVLMTPLANSSSPSPPIRVVPVAVNGAAPVMSSVAHTVPPGVPCTVIEPLLTSPLAVTIVEALNDVPIVIAPVLVSVPPIFTAPPPSPEASIANTPWLLRLPATVSDAAPVRVSCAPEMILRISTQAAVESVLSPLWITA